MFANLKSIAVERGVRTILAPYLDGIGTLNDLSIDTKARTVRAELALKGEEEAVTVKVGYDLHGEADSGLSVSVVSFEGSREWMYGAFDKFVKGQRFRVPEGQAGMVRIALG